MAIATGFYPDQRTHRQAAVEPLCFPITVDKLVLGDLSGLRIENRYLLKTGMKITPYNLHRRLLLVPDRTVLYRHPTGSSLKPSTLFNQCSPWRTWAEKDAFPMFLLDAPAAFGP